MGLNTWAALVGTNEKPAIAGDVAMMAGEVTPVLKALRKNGLDVVAIHHHMTQTQPTIFFLHYWGTGTADKLAAGFKAALGELGEDETRVATIAEATMRWITRENVKVDRVACPWLIKRFVDPDAEFLFVPEAQLLATAAREQATPFDATRFPEVRLNHRGERCTFEAILEDFRLADAALHRLGEIVRAADVQGQEHITPEGVGLRAIAEGFAALGMPDEERLRLQFPVYDALYAYAQRR